MLWLHGCIDLFGAQGDIAIDDVRIVCSEHQIGHCKCKEGYALASNGDCIPNVMTVIRTHDALSHVTSLFEGAKLDAVLGGEGVFTVFVPTERALAKLTNQTVWELLDPENKKTVTAMMKCVSQSRPIRRWYFTQPAMIRPVLPYEPRTCM